MNLTKARLKQIIKEEIEKLAENDDFGPRWDNDPEEAVSQHIEMINNELEFLLDKMNIDEKAELVDHINTAFPHHASEAPY